MFKAVRDRWIADLRSGKFKQGKGYLRIQASDNSYAHCCLGVLASQFADSPYGLYEKDGLTRFGGEIEQSTFTRMNDKLGYSFEEIADYIEENVTAV
jgi:hypothetical protein